jgi:hypothetical protein
MTDIVAVAFGSYVTNEPASIARALQAGLKPRLITRVQAECLAKIFNLDTWKQLAAAPVLLAPEALATLQASVAASGENQPPAPSEPPTRKRKPRATRAKSATKAAPRHS